MTTAAMQVEPGLAWPGLHDIPDEVFCQPLALFIFDPPYSSSHDASEMDDWFTDIMILMYGWNDWAHLARWGS